MDIPCIIIDDDSVFQTILKEFIEKTEGLTLVKTFNNAIEGSNFLTSHAIDIVFLDVEMPEMTGLELLKVLPYQPQVILISSKQQYALDAFEFEVTDYILKPKITYSRFLSALNKAKKNLDLKYDYFFVKEDSKLIKINLSEISYVEAYGDYVKIYTGDKYRMILSPLKNILNKLPSHEFAQIHRSYIVRIDKIEELEGNMIRINNKSIPVSRSQKDDILKRIKTL